MFVSCRACHMWIWIADHWMDAYPRTWHRINHSLLWFRRHVDSMPGWNKFLCSTHINSQSNTSHSSLLISCSCQEPVVLLSHKVFRACHRIYFCWSVSVALSSDVVFKSDSVIKSQSSHTRSRMQRTQTCTRSLGDCANDVHISYCCYLLDCQCWIIVIFRLNFDFCWRFVNLDSNSDMDAEDSDLRDSTTSPALSLSATDRSRRMLPTCRFQVFVKCQIVAEELVQLAFVHMCPDLFCEILHKS